MKKQIFLYLTVALFISHLTSFAQSAPEVDSRKIIDKGIKLHDEKKYNEAIIEFKKVSRNDTNYVLASTELINSYIADNKDSLALVLCNSLLDMPSSYIPNIMTFKANALDNLKRSDEAIKVYEDGMKKFPLNYSFTYEMGILKMRQEKYKEAYDWFVKSMKVNPYHANTHFQLGYLAALQGKLIPAMLAWQFYLTLDNSSGRAQTLVNALEQMSKNEYDFGTPVKVPELDEQDDFSEVETLVKSKVALGSKYKSETKLNFNITKQIQLIMEKMVVAKDDKGFFMQFYAPFFLEVYKKKFLEPYSYAILAGMDNKEVDSWMKKNPEKVSNLGNWLVDYLGENICTYEDNVNGKMMKVQHYYSKSNNIFAVGNKDSKNQNIGYWVYYYSNGMKKSEGAFNNKDQRTGQWKFYATTGLITTTENYVDGNVEGLVESYFTNGSILSRRNYSKSLMDGEQTNYYSTSIKMNSYQLKANVENGKQVQYHKNGKVEYEINVVEDKYQGDLMRYYMNGHLKEKSTFKDNKRNGKFTEYYNYPENAISEEVNYEKGFVTGIYKSYYQNGGLAETGEYNKDGEKVGVWKTFNDDNILTKEESYNNGKNSGTSKYYSEKGKLAEEYVYKNEMLQEYKAYDKDGKVIYQNKKEGKNNYDATLYYPNGNKKREGRVNNGVLDGKWVNYNINGFVTSEEFYTAGKKEGKFVSYFENGKVKSETDYVGNETNGFYKEYYKNGKLKKEGAYIQDKEVGVWNSYFTDGTIESVNFYKDGYFDNCQQYFCANGKLDFEDIIELNYLKKRLAYDSLGKVFQESALDKGTGLLEVNYPSGKLYWKNNYVGNLKQGEFVAVFPSGKTATLKNYKDNQLEGPAKYYYPSGKIKTEENYLDGDMHGKYTTYYENGNVKTSYVYEYGKETGKSYFYYPNKQVQTEYTYKNNLLEGPTMMYSESGELMIVKNFEENILVSYQYNDKTGNLTPPIEVKNETGTIKAYYKSGTPSIEYTIKNGVIEGKKILYFPDGKVADECSFVCDEREGKHQAYYPSGKLKVVENWHMDDKTGSVITYYENGKIKTEESCLNDRRYGPSKNYDETGKLIKTYFYYDEELQDEK